MAGLYQSGIKLMQAVFRRVVAMEFEILELVPSMGKVLCARVTSVQK